MHRFPLIMTKEEKKSSALSEVRVLPALIPIKCLKSEDEKCSRSSRQMSKFSIESILSSKGRGSKKSTDTNIPSYTCMIGQAILSSKDRKFTLGEIYEYIEKAFPSIEEKVKGWKNCVRHNLSLNECFIKVGPSNHGRGNNWTIHPSYLDSFLRGQFRKRMASRRRKSQIFTLPKWCKSHVHGYHFPNDSQFNSMKFGCVRDNHSNIRSDPRYEEQHYCPRIDQGPTIREGLSQRRAYSSDCSYQVKHFQHPFPLPASSQYSPVDRNAGTTIFETGKESQRIHPLLSLRHGTYIGDNYNAYEKGKLFNKDVAVPVQKHTCNNAKEDGKNYFLHIPGRSLGKLDPRMFINPNCGGQNEEGFSTFAIGKMSCGDAALRA